METEPTTQSEFLNAGKAIVQKMQPLYLRYSTSIGTKKIYGTVSEKKMARFLLISKMAEVPVYRKKHVPKIDE